MDRIWGDAYDTRRLPVVPHQSRNRPWEEPNGWYDLLILRQALFFCRQRRLQRRQRVEIHLVRILKNAKQEKQSNVSSSPVPFVLRDPAKVLPIAKCP
jgi:hypothetical protein